MCGVEDKCYMLSSCVFYMATPCNTTESVHCLIDAVNRNLWLGGQDHLAIPACDNTNSFYLHRSIFLSALSCKMTQLTISTFKKASENFPCILYELFRKSPAAKIPWKLLGLRCGCK